MAAAAAAAVLGAGMGGSGEGADAAAATAATARNLLQGDTGTAVTGQMDISIGGQLQQDLTTLCESLRCSCCCTSAPCRGPRRRRAACTPSHLPSPCFAAGALVFVSACSCIQRDMSTATRTSASPFPSSPARPPATHHPPVCHPPAPARSRCVQGCSSAPSSSSSCSAASPCWRRARCASKTRKTSCSRMVRPVLPGGQQ